MAEHEDHSLINTIAAAQYLGLSKNWLAKLRMTGEGPPYLKLGRLVRYRRADLMRWAEQGLRWSTSETALAGIYCPSKAVSFDLIS